MYLRDYLGDINSRPDNQKAITYAKTGVRRDTRAKARIELSSLVESLSRSYKFGSPVILPFGLIFPTDNRLESYYDFQIEGVGTKILVAELAGKYETIGIDAVAMAVNDVIRSGATPILLTDALHISKTDTRIVRSILSGVMKGARISRCPLASGETGDVADVLHESLELGSTPFDLFVSTLGLVEKNSIVSGEIMAGDVVIGLESSGIHSNGLSLARRLLVKQWGGLYELDESPVGLGGKRTLAEELLKPTRIYAEPILETQKSSMLKAAIHITGDGFSKFRRLLDFRRGKSSRLGFEFDSLAEEPPIFRLIEAAAKGIGVSISREEMFRTFNMGYGFAVVVSKEDEESALHSLNKYCRAEKIGRLVSSSRPKIALKGMRPDRKTILL